MSIMMPAADQAVLARRAEIVAALRAIVPGEGVIDSAAEMLAYESDGLTAYRQPPMVVVLPRWHSEAALLRHCCPARTDDVCSPAKPVARNDSDALVRRCCPPTQPTEACSVVSAMPRAVYVTISCRSDAEMSTSSSSASMPAGTCLAE